jgi:hypothetical protein
MPCLAVNPVRQAAFQGHAVNRGLHAVNRLPAAQVRAVVPATTVPATTAAATTAAAAIAVQTAGIVIAPPAIAAEVQPRLCS